jgi:hypothetical protein
MREKRWFPILYMFGVTAFFSSIIIAFASVTRGRVEANEELAFERADSRNCARSVRRNLSNAEVHPRLGKWSKNLRRPPAALTSSRRRPGRRLCAALLGAGFWAPSGASSHRAGPEDRHGIAFYQQNETPGWAPSITKKPFRSQFVGKVLALGESPWA